MGGGGGGLGDGGAVHEATVAERLAEGFVQSVIGTSLALSERYTCYSHICRISSFSSS